MIADKVKNQIFARSLERTNGIRFEVDRKVESPVSEIKKKTRIAAEDISKNFRPSPKLVL
jgi:hypothetical protein